MTPSEEFSAFIKELPLTNKQRMEATKLYRHIKTVEEMADLYSRQLFPDTTGQ